MLLSKSKVYHASPTILVEFTQAKHLLGQRFCISRSKAQTYPEDTNGKIPVLAVPLSAFDTYVTKDENNQQIRDTLLEIGWWA